MSRIAVKTGSFLAGDVTARALAFAVLILGARRLGPREFGMFALVYGLVAIGLLVSDLGLTPLVLRHLSRPGRFSRPVFWSGAVTNLVFGTVIYVCLLMGFALIAPAYVQLVLVYAPVLLIQAVASSADAVLLASNRAPRLGLIRVFGNTSLLVAAVSLVSLHPSAASLGAAFMIGSGVKCLLSVTTVRHIIGAPQFAFRLTWVMLAKAFPFAGAALASYLYFRVDVVLIAALATRSTLGVYAGAYRFIDGLILVPGALAYVVFPLWMRDPDARAATGRMMKLLVAFGIFIVVAGEGVAPDVVRIVLGRAFEGSIPVLQILLLGVPILFADVVLVWLAYAYGRERAVVAVGAAALVANVAANAALIPQFGARGAAVATVVSELVNFGGYLVMFRSELATAAASCVSTALRLAAVASAVTPILVMQEVFLPRSVATPIAVAVFAVTAWGVRLVAIGDFRGMLGSGRTPAPSAS